MIDTNKIFILKDQIQSNLSSRMRKFDDIELSDYVFKHCILTGGAIASLFHYEEPNDWDLYFKRPESISTFKQYVHDEKHQAQIEDVNPKYHVVTDVDGKLVTAQAVTYKNKLQVITMDTAKTRETFDYIHCMPWYDIDAGVLYMSEAQYVSIRDKKLVVNPDAQNLPSSWRTDKYEKRGWTKSWR